MFSIAILSEFIDQLLPPVTQVNTEPLTVVKDEPPEPEINIHNILQSQPPVLPISLVKTEPLTIVKNELPESQLMEIGMDDIPVSSGEEVNRHVKNIDPIVSHVSSVATLSGFIDQLLPPVPPVTQVNNHKKTRRLKYSWAAGTAPRKVKKKKQVNAKPLTAVNKPPEAEINIHNILQIQPSVLSLSVVENEPLTIEKNSPESELMENNMDDIPISSGEEISWDVKNIDIVSHALSEDLIKHETVSKDKHESKHSESVERQVIVKTEDAPFIKIENITESEIFIETDEDTRNENVNRGTGQGMVEVQDSNEHFNALGNIEPDFVESYGTCEITLLNSHKEKVKVIEAPLIPVETHEYISVAKDKHVCNYCQYASNNLRIIIAHITKMHRKVHTMYLCSYCSFKSKWKSSLENHIIGKHRDTKLHKDLQWFKCHLCDAKSKTKGLLKKHMVTHVQDRLKLCPICGKGFKAEFHVKSHVRQVHNKESLNRYKCQECEYITISKQYIKLHIENHHMGMHECSECDYKTKYIKLLKRHKKRHETRYQCDKCHYTSYSNPEFYRHKLIHLEPDEIHFFHCYHCPFKSRKKVGLQIHVLRHFKKGEVTFHCYICDFTTLKRGLITKHIKKHSKVQSKPEIAEGS